MPAERCGVVVPGMPHVPTGRHPVIVEIWLVQDGLMEIAGLTAHSCGNSRAVPPALDSVERRGRVGRGTRWRGGSGRRRCARNVARPGGMVVGRRRWCRRGAAAGAATMGRPRAASGAQWAAAAGRRTSETNSRVIGTYNEIIVTVPCRSERPGDLSRDFAFVLGTYTDSMASMLGESLVGWGYRKSQAFGTRADDGALEVSTDPSGSLLRLFNREELLDVSAAVVRSTATQVLAALSRPLLGVLPANQLMVSFLDRSFEEQAVQVTPVSVRLESSDAFLPGLSGFVSDLDAIGSGNPWGAFAVRGLPVRLSYPRVVE